MKIAMIGTRGVPAQYGGFETAVEEIGWRLAGRGHSVVVFVRERTDDTRTYRGMRLVYRPALRQKVLETLSHTALSVIHKEATSADVAFVFNAANTPLIPLLTWRRIPVALHVDGLEWRRSKWGAIGRRFYLSCERLAPHFADELIADAEAIRSYYKSRYEVSPQFIPYGAPIVRDPKLSRLSELGLEKRRYHLVVARLEPENNVHLAMAGYAGAGLKLPMVVVGAAPYGKKYVAALARISEESGIRMLGAVWDQELLTALYGGCLTYIHGHSVGGTNPSLLRAMGAASPVLALDVEFNREVLQDSGVFWDCPGSLGDLLANAEANEDLFSALGRRAQQRAQEAYDWEAVTDQYERLAQGLLAR